MARYAQVGPERNKFHYGIRFQTCIIIRGSSSNIKQGRQINFKKISIESRDPFWFLCISLRFPPTKRPITDLTYLLELNCKTHCFISYQ